VGVDMELFIEYSTISGDNPWPSHQMTDLVLSSNKVASLTYDSFWVDRDQLLFHALATSALGRPPLLPTRGLPPYISESLSIKIMIPVKEVKEPNDYDSITREAAAKAVGEGKTIYGGIENQQTRQMVITTVFKHYSWLLYSELVAAIDRHQLTDRLSAKFKAILAAMRSLEQDLGSGRSRATFFFDGDI
jgi:hypothetical protein